MKLCNEFRAIIKCMKAAFYRPDYQKFLMCPLIKRLGRAIVSKHETGPLKGSAKFLKHSAELLRAKEKTKSSAACLCYNTAHAVPLNNAIGVILRHKSCFYMTSFSARTGQQGGLDHHYCCTYKILFISKGKQ